MRDEEFDTRASRAAAVDEDLQLETRIAWYYYVGNLTQQQIAERLGTSRVRINRLLSACRESGVVQININSALADCVDLEQRLIEMYGLSDAVVVPTPKDAHLVREAIGVGAGSYLNQILTSGQTIALGWGRTLVHTWRALRAGNNNDMSVVSMLGGMSSCAWLNTFEIVFDFARRLQANCYYLAAPIYASSREARDVLLEQQAIRETCDKARQADIALLTAGDMHQSLIIEYGVDAKQSQTLERAGAVGDLLGHFIDSDGQLLDHELNRRTVALDLDDLKTVKSVVLLSGGPHKVDVTKAALRGEHADVLITDEITAGRLVGAKRSKSRR